MRYSTPFRRPCAAVLMFGAVQMSIDADGRTGAFDAVADGRVFGHATNGRVVGHHDKRLMFAARSGRQRKIEALQLTIENASIFVSPVVTGDHPATRAGDGNAVEQYGVVLKKRYVGGSDLSDAGQ